MSARTITLGTLLAIEGSLHKVIALEGNTVTLQGPGGRLVCYSVRELAERASLLSGSGASATDEVGSLFAALDAGQRDQLRLRIEHVREVLTGYRDETPDYREPPRQEYAAGRGLGERQLAKAAELGVDARTVRRWCDMYEREGPIALIDRRTMRGSNPLHGVDDRWIAACHKVLADHVDLSRPTQKLLLNRIERQVALEEEAEGQRIRRPSPGRARAALVELTRGSNALRGSTRGKRSIANRPAAPYGTLKASRPGEYVLLDSTPLDVFAMEPISLRWVSVELTVALDLYSRAISAVRLTPGSTKAEDVALLLYDVIGGQARPPALTDLAVSETAHDPIAAQAELPVICPETLVIDNGKQYVSEHVRTVAWRLGVSIQPGRPYTPTDKAPVERFFRTLREELLVALPGYKGPDIHSRGKRVEENGYYFINELEAIIRDWVNTVYHQRPHQGLVDEFVPGVRYTPVEKLECGVARAGLLRIPPRPDLLFDFLPIEWRTVQHYGVEIDGLRYDGPGLDRARNRRSPHGGAHAGKWPIRVDPADRSRVFFHDDVAGSWHTLRWRHYNDCPQPFTSEVLRYAREIARRRHAVPDDRRALSELLERWGQGGLGDRRERRMYLRMSELGDPISASLEDDSPTGSRYPGVQPFSSALQGDDDLDAELEDDSDFYSGAFGVDE